MTRKQLVALVFGGLVAVGSVGVAQADPGPHHGNNAHGLCTAYFNGKKNGHENHNPQPFAALEAAAADAQQSVFEYCSDVEGPGTGNGNDGGDDGIGGNPDHGRFPECFDENSNTGNDACPSN